MDLAVSLENTDPDHRLGQHWVAYVHRRQLKGRVLRPHRKTTLYKGLREFHEETLL